MNSETGTPVVTYISTFGATINVCPKCESVRPWPKDSHGAEYAQVSRGLHAGGCDLCGAGLPAWLTPTHAAKAE